MIRPVRPGGGGLAGAFVRFEVLEYTGKGDRVAAAREALRGIPWVEPGAITYDEQAGALVVPARTASLATDSARAALERAGFQIGTTSYLTSSDGRDPDQLPPSQSLPGFGAVAASEAPPRAGPAALAAGLRIRLQRGAEVTAGPVGCPVFVVAREVWSLKEGRKTQTLEGNYESGGLRSLSADGRYFAATDKPRNASDMAVRVWSCETGKQVLEVPGDKDTPVDLLALIPPGRLLLGGRHSDQIQLWDIEARSLAHAITGPSRLTSGDRIAFSPDGRHLALAARDTIVACQTRSGKMVAWMERPPAVHKDVAGWGEEGAQAIADAQRPGGRMGKLAFDWIAGIAFSPDGTELAAVDTRPFPRLLCWSGRGKIAADVALPVRRLADSRACLDWLPDASGWVVDGMLVDRRTSRLLLKIRRPHSFGGQVQSVLDQDHWLCELGHFNPELVVLTIPWEKLRASVQQMEAGKPAHVMPGQAISVRADMAGLPGDQQAAAEILETVMGESLARHGIPVEPGKPTVLRARLAQSDDDLAPICQRQSPFVGIGQVAGGKSLTPERVIVLELLVEGQDGPLWCRALGRTSVDSAFREGTSDPNRRKSLKRILGEAMDNAVLPYYVPVSQDNVILPAVLDADDRG